MIASAVRAWIVAGALAVLLAGCGTAGIALLMPALGHDGEPTGAASPARRVLLDLARQDAVAQNPDVILVKTVGLTAEPCATTGSVDIFAGTPVYYCYTLTNNGETAVRAVSLFDTYFPAEGPVAAPVNPAELEPHGSLQVVVAIPNAMQTLATQVDTTSSAEWTLEANGNVFTVQSNPTTVDVAALATSATLTVGADRNTCASTTALTSVTITGTAYYCLKLQNSSNITLTDHRVSIPALSLIDFPIGYAVGPTATMVVTSTTPGIGTIPQLAHGLDQPTMSSQAIVTSTTAGGLPVVTISTPPSTVTGPSPTLSVVKSINNDAKTCSNISSLQVNYQQNIFYCLVVANSNSFTYTRHTFAEPASQIAATFDAVLPPGGRITLTNETLPNYGVQPVLGPIEARSAFNNTLTYTATNPAFNYTGVAIASASVLVLAPTPTDADPPTPTFTPFPTVSPFPTVTFTPVPATPTIAPTWTPSPTFTPSPTVLAFTTPGGVAATPYPQIGPGGVVPSQVGAPDAFTSPLDPVAAATATAAVQLGFVTPVIDPIAATATAATLFGIPPPPFDPTAATATTAALLGLPAPIFDSAGATATAAVQFGLVPPDSNPLDPFGGTATASALAQQFPSPLEPAAMPTPAEAAAIPPPVTVITVTATPTLTPVESPTQRAVEPPTPLPPLDARSIFAQVVDTAGMTMALLWFLAGSILFFITAGVLAGLSFRARERNRFLLADDDATQLEVDAPPGQPSNQSSGQPPASVDDGNWPASLT